MTRAPAFAPATFSGTTRRGGVSLYRAVAALALITLLWPCCGRSQPLPCRSDTDAPQIADALHRIERSVDPCGESAQVAAVLRALDQCTKVAYRICTNTEIDRNVFDRPVGEAGEALPRLITWNPALRSPLEFGCDGDAEKPVSRDPTASLLHELVHAAQDCAGLNPGEHELEAVRIENIYRRATGLCQRRRYGDVPLPAEMLRLCSPGNCSCAAPVPDPGSPAAQPHDTPSMMHADASQSAAAARSGDSMQQPLR